MTSTALQAKAELLLRERRNRLTPREVVLLSCLAAAERQQAALVAWVDEQGRAGRVVTIGTLDPDNPASWPLAAMHPSRVVPEKSSQCIHLEMLPLLRADLPAEAKR